MNENEKNNPAQTAQQNPAQPAKRRRSGQRKRSVKPQVAESPTTEKQAAVQPKTANTRKRNQPAAQKTVKNTVPNSSARVPQSKKQSVLGITIPKAAPQSHRQGGSRQTLKIIPLGGLGEIGKNMTYYEYGGDALIVDCGLSFPDDAMLGVDIVIPDFTYLIENQKKIRGLCITHGHEDHIGSIPYLLKHFQVPLYGTRLTLGLVEGKLKEHGLLRDAKMNIVSAGDVVKLGCLSAEFIHVNHSIPDSCALAIFTPVGTIIQTGDFKIDFTPIDGDVMNLSRFGELGSQGVLALLADSTNAERIGFSESERTVGAGLDKLFSDASEKRIIVATFASNVHRVQQLMDAAIKHGRKVAISGRSMENVSAKALELGYLKAPKDLLIDVEQAETMPAEKVVIITTGSQGEPMSALTRMARKDHKKISVSSEDCIIISANPIPGNEKAVTNVVNDLLMLGASVVYEKEYKIHVSGHASQDELKMIQALVKPKFFIPVHGEYKHLQRHAELAGAMGVPPERIHVGENGEVIEFTPDSMKVNTTVTSGSVMVDGLGIGDVGSIVLRDRKHLAEDGLIVIIATIQRSTGKILAGPDIVSRGFVYVREAEDMIAKAQHIARKSIETCISNGSREWGILKTKVRDDVGDYVWQTTKRRPMLLPVIQEVQ